MAGFWASSEVPIDTAGDLAVEAEDSKPDSLGLGYTPRRGEKFAANCVEDVIGHRLEALHNGVSALEIQRHPQPHHQAQVAVATDVGRFAAESAAQIKGIPKPV